MTAAGGRESGVALIEMLAALSVVAIMAALMAGLLGQMRAVAVRHGEVAARAELAAAADHLQRTLSVARPLPVGGVGPTEGVASDGGAGPTERVVLDGTETGLRFVAATPRGGGGGRALRTVAIGTVPQDGALTLVEALSPRRPGASPVRVPVLDDLAAVRFAYADTDGVFGPAWSRATLPAAVRITLARQVGPRRVTVRRVARPR